MPGLPPLSAITVVFLFPILFITAYAGYSGVFGFWESLRYALKNFGSLLSNHLLILIMAIPSMLLIDTLFGMMLFSFLDWIVYADPIAIDNMNVVLQCLTYVFLFTIVLCIQMISFVLSTYNLKEINDAEALLKDIEMVGTRRRLRGMEMEGGFVVYGL